MSTEPQTVTQRYPGLAFAVVIVLVLGFVAFSFFTWREPQHAGRPVLVGTAESGTFWKSPLTNSSNEGFSVKGYRVEVYETVVVATNPETGVKHVRPNGFYSELTVK